MVKATFNPATEAQASAYSVGRPRASDAVAKALCDVYGCADEQENYDDFPPDIAALLQRLDHQMQPHR